MWLTNLTHSVSEKTDLESNSSLSLSISALTLPSLKLKRKTIMLSANKVSIYLQECLIISELYAVMP